MREIKFRAWDKDKKEYVFAGIDYAIRCLGINYARETPMDCPFIGYSKEEQERFDIEQFTGLHDKNGKEIYEGDILNHEGERKHPGVIQFARGMFGLNWNYAENQDPEWCDGQLYGAWGQLHNLRKLCDDFLDDMVIIGNIHENLKLLDKPAPDAGDATKEWK